MSDFVPDFSRQTSYGLMAFNVSFDEHNALKNNTYMREYNLAC